MIFKMETTTQQLKKFPAIYETQIFISRNESATELTFFGTT
jgi:hypothetical protein